MIKRNIELIISEIVSKVPKIEKIINQINFQHSHEENEVAYLRGTTIFFTDKLFLDFSLDEQQFIIAHEVMHYIRHNMTGKLIFSKNKDNVLLNFVEDAQINQVLLKFDFVAPSGVVLLSDALDYPKDELYNLLFPKILEIRGWAKNITDWEKFSTTSDILNNESLEEKNNKII